MTARREGRLIADWPAHVLAGADWLWGSREVSGPCLLRGRPRARPLPVRQRQRRDARCDGEGREPAGVREGAGGLPQEVGEAEGARLGRHGEVGQAQGAGALRRELVLHAGSLHGASPVPAGRGGRGLHGQGVRRPAAPRGPAQPLQPRLGRRGQEGAAGPGGAQGGGEGPGRGPEVDSTGAAGPGSHRWPGGCCQQEALREPINHFPPKLECGFEEKTPKIG